MWSPKRELAQKAAEAARQQHPEGFNKRQLIECSKEVYGGYGEAVAGTTTSIHKKVRTMEDVNNLGNAMAFIDGGYPVGMSGCFVVGINGDCGYECPVLLEGDCEHGADFLEGIDELEHVDQESKGLIKEWYGDE